MVQVKLKDGSTIGGEFIGTYMQHVHLLTGEDINYFKCDNIQFVTKTDDLNAFEYDCSKNTISADILFPPQLNPMTGEWETVIPRVFNPRKRKVLAKEEELAKLKNRNSENKKIHTLRGFHYQVYPYGEDKIISCIQGQIHNIVIDMRKKSKTFMKWKSFIHIFSLNTFLIIIENYLN